MGWEIDLWGRVRRASEAAKAQFAASADDWESARLGVAAEVADDFFTLRNLDSLLLAVSTVGIISCTMLFCLASGNFDLSVGAIVPCAGVVAAVRL